MKKTLAIYLILMTAVFLILPLLIVRPASSSELAALKEGGQPQDAAEPKADDRTEDEKTGDEAAPKVVKEAPSPAIGVYDHLQNKVVEMDLEEYVTGVVTAEMPASFETEALKAQAVAARTYAYRKLLLGDTSAAEHKGALICTDPVHCQAWTSMAAAKKNWGIFKAAFNEKKITKAVKETRGIIMTYEGEIANPLYHANSGGATENSEEVWEGVYEPYLRSVISRGEDKSTSFKVTISIEAEEFVRIFKKKYPDAIINAGNIGKELEIIDNTTGGRVKNIRVGTVTIKGTEFRSLLSLRSANFTFAADGGMLSITTLGYGHGVGMSQWGANNLAQKGAKYDEILKYYYRGISLVTRETFE